MAVRAVLTLNGKEYEIQQFQQIFSQYSCPSNCIPNCQVQFGHLECILKTPEDNDILELMLPNKYSLNIEGKLEIWAGEDLPQRRINFTKGIIINYGETFDPSSSEGMITRVVVAAWQMDINKLPMLRYKMGYPWVFVDWEEPKPIPEKSYTPPVPLVRKVEIASEKKYIHYLAGDTIALRVVSYNLGNITEQEKNNVCWAVDIDGTLENPMKTDKGIPYKGENIEVLIPKHWAGKQVRFMPYLKKPLPSVGASVVVENLLDIYTSKGKYLFSLLPNQTYQSQRLTAKEAYAKGIQWFSPTSDDYLKLALLSKQLFIAKELKHFSWSDIVSFGEVDRSMFEYRSNGSGDWKAQGKPGDGYLLVTVEGIPYWADAIGQVPFTLNCYRNSLKALIQPKLAKLETIKIGKRFGDGKIFGGKADEGNTYDNEMIRRATDWAEQRYIVVGINEWNRNAIIKTTNHAPSLLSKPTK